MAQISELFMISSINQRIKCTLSVVLVSGIGLRIAQAAQILEWLSIMVICGFLSKGLVFLGVACEESVRNLSCLSILGINTSDLVKDFRHFSIILIFGRLKVDRYRDFVNSVIHGQQSILVAIIIGVEVFISIGPEVDVLFVFVFFFIFGLTITLVGILKEPDH